MNKKQVIGVVVVLVAVVAIVGGVLAMGGEDNSEDHQDQGHSSSSESSKKADSSSSAADTGEVSQTNTVTIAEFAYTPATIQVKVGTKVTWTNTDTARHDVVADDPSSDAPNSELFGKGESYSFTFNKAGTYAYHCTPHPYMKAKVIVTE